MAPNVILSLSADKEGKEAVSSTTGSTFEVLNVGTAIREISSIVYDAAEKRHPVHSERLVAAYYIVGFCFGLPCIVDLY